MTTQEISQAACQGAIVIDIKTKPAESLLDDLAGQCRGVILRTSANSEKLTVAQHSRT